MGTRKQEAVRGCSVVGWMKRTFELRAMSYELFHFAIFRIECHLPLVC